MDFFVKITLQQWRRINSLISAAEQALKAADDEILKVVFEHHDQGNEAEVLLVVFLLAVLAFAFALGCGLPLKKVLNGDRIAPV